LKIIHRVSLTPSEAQREILLSLGIQLIESKSPLVRLASFEIEESQSQWPEIKALIGQWKPADFTRTEFTEAELAAASFLQMLGGQHGYPQPSDDFGYLKVTYDLKDYCAACGIGKEQAAPFRMQGEPKWGKNRILQLNWVYDAYFVSPSTWEDVFSPLGVGKLSVVDHRTGIDLRTVVQLDIQDVARASLACDAEYPFEVCATCGRKKLLPITRGFFPGFTTAPAISIGKTQEYFGSGASAWHAVVVSRDVYKAIQGHQLRGAMFVPLQDAHGA